jgi:hypothetical protein
MAKLDEAKAILAALGLPAKQQGERSWTKRRWNRSAFPSTGTISCPMWSCSTPRSIGSF